ncbi:MAG: PrgI family protein [Candidatus Pacebacteria bacterium]|nr:PrgI family protein [Candidatus Paceibacterota bacterium]
MQFQVPQFIETEDKVVGPFSLRQFLYIGAGGLISAIFYFFVQTWLFIIAAIIIMGIAAAIAFVKVNGQPFTKIMSAALDFYWKPQAYIWKPEATAPAMQKPARESGISLESIASGMALHKSWENLQTGTPIVPKTSDREFIENRMNQRYQIMEKLTGDRQAAKRVDYR